MPQFAERAVPDVVKELETLSPKNGVATALVLGGLTVATAVAYFTSTGSADASQAQTPGPPAPDAQRPIANWNLGSLAGNQAGQVKV